MTISKRTFNYIINKNIPTIINDLNTDFFAKSNLLLVLADMLKIVLDGNNHEQISHQINKVLSDKKSNFRNLMYFFFERVSEGQLVFLNKPQFRIITHEEILWLNLTLSYLRNLGHITQDDEYFSMLEVPNRSLINNNLNKICVYLKSFPVNCHAGAHFGLFKGIIFSLVHVYGRENVNIIVVGQEDLTGKHADKEHFIFFQLKSLGVIKNENLNYIALSDYANGSYNSVLKKIKGVPSLVMGGGVLGERIMSLEAYRQGSLSLYLKFNAKNKVDNLYVDRVLSPISNKNKEHELKIIYPMNREMFLTLLDKRVERTYDASNKKVKIISVLSKGRIEKCLKNLKEEQVEHIRSIINKGNVEWHFLGVQDSNYIECMFGKHNLVVHSFVKDLVDYYNEMDIFFHLPGAAGGGTGMLMASLAGLPVLALDETDAAGYIDESTLLKSSEGLFSELDSLIDSYLKQRDLAQKQFMFIQETQTDEFFGMQINSILSVLDKEFKKCHI